jgi:hypothetical protein
VPVPPLRRSGCGAVPAKVGPEGVEPPRNRVSGGRLAGRLRPRKYRVGDLSPSRPLERRAATPAAVTRRQRPRRAEGTGVEPARAFASPALQAGAIARWLALPYRAVPAGLEPASFPLTAGRTTVVLRDSRSVRMVGFEPTLSGSRSRRIAKLSHILSRSRASRLSPLPAPRWLRAEGVGVEPTRALFQSVLNRL